MSGADSFFDTNVLLYLFSGELDKADRVEALLERPGVISVQVLNEFAAVATRKLGLAYGEVREVLGTIRTLCHTHALTVEHHEKALELAERYRFSFYDAAVVASALLAGCKTLYSEDMQHRQVIEKQLTIFNPFVKPRS